MAARHLIHRPQVRALRPSDYGEYAHGGKRSLPHRGADIEASDSRLREAAMRDVFDAAATDESDADWLRHLSI